MNRRSKWRPERLVLGPAEDEARAGVPARHQTGGIERQDRVIGGALEQEPHAFVGLALDPQAATQLEQADALPRQGFERQRPLVGEIARGAVENAERADRMARGQQGHAGAEPEERRADDMRAVAEFRVGAGIVDDDQAGALDHESAEGLAQLDTAPGAEPAFTLVPEPVGVDEPHGGERHARHQRGEPGDIVEILVARGDQFGVARQRLETRRLGRPRLEGRVGRGRRHVAPAHGVRMIMSPLGGQGRSSRQVPRLSDEIRRHPGRPTRLAARWTSPSPLSIKRASPGEDAQVAQLVEHATENRSVGGSIPPLGTTTALSW